jgi:hypothetical protein
MYLKKDTYRFNNTNVQGNEQLLKERSGVVLGFFVIRPVFKILSRIQNNKLELINISENKLIIIFAKIF